MNLYTGVVENRKDPLKLGRCQVRIVGLHTHDKTLLPTDDLPWAYPMQPITSAAISGIGNTPVGVVEGTWVVIAFRDEDEQQPIILGTIGGIPQEESKSIDQDDDDYISIDSVTGKKENAPQGGVLLSESGSIVTDGNGNAVTTGETKQNNAEVPYVPVVSGKIPDASAKTGIDFLNKAMTNAGFTGKYGRAAILGIVGGESNWIPKSEGYNYSAEALQKVFAKTFANKPELTKKYARWKGTREAFFDFVYSPENNGSNLGNTEVGDGGKFYGRGFIQITGRSNYQRISRLIGIDIVSQPELLNVDYDVSAQAAVAFFNDKIKNISHEDPSYFQAALKAVGGAKDGWAKKEAYYQYFLGETPPPEQTDKTTKPGEEVQGITVDNSGIPADRQRNLVIGFSDPNMKYPLRQYIGEPDTNRLARGKIEGTIVEYKDEKRLTDVETGGGFKWQQPDIPYNAKYPYNKVMETESGHVMEFDDTPDNERIHVYHRKGTYTEIDCNGTQVNRIVGDGYHIIERSGYVFISGDCNVTAEGSVRILVQSDAFIDVAGDTKINMGGRLDLNIAADMSINAGGELKIKASNIKIDSESDVNMTSFGSSKLTSYSEFNINASGRTNIEGSTIHLAEGAATADQTNLGDAIAVGDKSSKTFAQLKTPPRNLEQELGYETPEENLEDSAKAYHENRTTENTNDKATVIETTPQPENNAVSTKADCTIIYNMTSFPYSYVIHTDSTGYKWTLGAMTKGNIVTSGVYGKKQYNVQEIVCNMKALCVNILGPINETFGTVGKSWMITSAYRNYIPTGGSSKSQHLIGSAVDISIGGNFAYKINYDAAVKLATILPYDQLILEYRDPGINGNKNQQRINWIHISYDNYGNGRKQSLTFLNDKTHSKGLTYLGS